MHDRSAVDAFGVGHERGKRLLGGFLFLLEDVERGLGSLVLVGEDVHDVVFFDLIDGDLCQGVGI